MLQRLGREAKRKMASRRFSHEYFAETVKRGDGTKTIFQNEKGRQDSF